MHRISILRCSSGNIKHDKAAIREAANYLSGPAHGLWDFPRSGVHYKHFGVQEKRNCRGTRHLVLLRVVRLTLGRGAREILVHVMEMSGCS